jgi:hypothetical protein
VNFEHSIHDLVAVVENTQERLKRDLKTGTGTLHDGGILDTFPRGKKENKNWGGGATLTWQKQKFLQNLSVGTSEIEICAI